MKLSPTQQETVDKMKAHGGKLVRLLGGFWTYPGCSSRASGFTGAEIPDWYTSTPTVKALEKKGVIERTHEYPEEWKDVRKLKEGA